MICSLSGGRCQSRGSKACVAISLTTDAAGYTSIKALAGIGWASSVFHPLDSALSGTHPARAAGATNGVGKLVWTAERNAEITAAYEALAADPAFIASQARQAANLAALATDTVGGDINKLTRD